MTELGQFLGKVIDNQSRENEAKGDPSKINSWFIVNNYRLKMKCTNISIYKKDVAGNAFIVGDPTLSQLPAVVGTGTAAYALHQQNTSPTSVMTDVGRRQFAKWVANETPPQPKYIAWGDDNTAFVTTQTALVSEIRRGSAVTASQATTAGMVKTEYEFAANAGYTGNLKEVGFFDGTTTTNNMWYRSVISPALTVSATLSIKVYMDYLFEDETSAPNALITNKGLNHFRDFIYNNESIFGYGELATQTTAVLVTDTDLNGTTDRNTISIRERKNYSVQLSLQWGTAEFNETMGAIGLYETQTTSTLVAASNTSRKDKENTFKIINYNIYLENLYFRIAFHMNISFPRASSRTRICRNTRGVCE